MARNKKECSPFASNLRDLLRERNLTQKQVAKICGLTPSTIHDWCNGTHPYDVVAVAKLAKTLNADFQKLLTSIPSIPENISLGDVFHIENQESVSGIYQIEIKRLVKKCIPNAEG